MDKVRTRKIFIDEDPNQVETITYCPECSKKGDTHLLRYMFINFDVAIYKCSSPNCMYPYTDFKYKNFADNTIYRQEIISVESINSSPPPHYASTELDNILDDLASPHQVTPFANSNEFTESAAIARLESELNDLLSDHLGSPSDGPQKPCLSTTQNNETCKAPPKKLSKAYEFMKQINNKNDEFKIPPAPGKSPGCKKSFHASPKSPRKKEIVKMKEKQNSQNKKMQVKEFSSSFLRQIENHYSNIKSPSQTLKFEMITTTGSGGDGPQMILQYAPDLKVNFKLEPA